MLLFIVSLVLISAIVAIKFSNRFGVPFLLLFFSLGISFNFLGVDFEDYVLVDEVAQLALLIIMFYGGFGTNLTLAKPVMKASILMSTLGVLFTSCFTGIFAFFVLRVSLLEALLLGSLIGSTDFASVYAILKSQNLNLKYGTASLLEVESGSNDPTAYTMTMVILALLAGGDQSIPGLILSQLVFGLGLGLGLGKLSQLIIQNISFEEDGLLSILISAIAILTFALTSLLGGNGFLAVYILGIYMGQIEYQKKPEVVFFFEGFSRIMQIGLFFLLGLLSNPQLIIQAFPYALILMLFLTFIARPLVTFALLKPLGLKNNQIILIAMAGFRGAASIAFAIMVTNYPIRLESDVFHLVFGVCLLSSLIQGSLMSFITKRVQMLDPNDTVYNTFNYYNARNQIGFIEMKIEADNPIVGQSVAELKLDLAVIVAKLIRAGKVIVPRGHTRIQAGDRLVLGGQSYFDPNGSALTEIKVAANHPWLGMALQDIEMADNELIVMMRSAQGESIVPQGDTEIHAGDKLIILRNKRT
ncbi:potassium/proton antiporter [Eremococcus coleocola]|uniref:Potassium/proton antiporter n=1 Tax=Eremococcus coleocola ACS-139-V-Col8 TaxID=908337 RepID=E4KPW3_9LACT|nr:potassium/proton antiporter [Eremococcus coleocola]EFR31376.1 potassium/proton antiporter [Eremococcus coleocola ACS-139-V-Col8]